MNNKKRPMAAAFIIENGKLLLIHNIKHGLRIEPPGGKLHDGESYEEATKREVKEELGIDVEPVELFGVYDIDTPEGPFDVHLFLCAIISGEPRGDLEPDKISGFAWYGFDDLIRLQEEGSLVPDVIDALPKLRQYLR